MTSAPAIGFEYRPSRWLGRVLLLACSLAILALWLSATPLALQLSLSVVAAVLVRRAAARFVHTPVTAAGWGREGGWTLRMADGQDVPALLGSFRVVGEQAIWLRLRVPEHGHVALLLAPDNSDADIRRRLRMRLAAAASAGMHVAGTLPAARGPTVWPRNRR